ncbi:retrovirus-related pol polyprotein from transposon TNT 1-94 [Tanacetum coccineum]
MASEMSKFSIPIFDGKMDFTVWKMTIEDVLVQQGIDEALEEKKPVEMKDDVWKTMQKKASSTIRLALAPEIKYSVLKEKTPKDIWDKLTNIYASKSFNVDDAIKDVRNNKPCVGDNERIGRGMIVLVVAVANKLYSKMTLEEVRKFKTRSSKGRSKSRMGGDRDMSVVECYYCGDKGHMQVRCPQFREDLKSLRDSKGKKKVDSGEMNVVDNESSHICNDRAMFETLNGKGQFGEIKVGSKQMMKIEGVGSVRFKLHDGSVKTALNVKYVPGAARNILSLGVLTSRGYRYVGRKDTCKVYKRDQLVIRGRKIPNNLCYLEREALQGRTCCGGNKRKKNIDKRVHFSDKDEVLGILS